MTTTFNSNIPRNQDGTLASPCIGICTIDTATNLCTGCQRTLAEITAWPSLHEEDKCAIWQQLGGRQTKR